MDKPKIELSEIHLNFEVNCNKIIGQTLAEVEYFEINYGPEYPDISYKTRYTNLDSVDFSIFFKTNDKLAIEFSWDWEFHEYGVGIRINGDPFFKEYRKSVVNCEPIWEKLIGQTITGIKVYWETVSEYDLENKLLGNYTYPQTIQIDFSTTNSVFISAAGFLDENDETIMGSLDNICVTDDNKLARKLKMIP